MARKSKRLKLNEAIRQGQAKIAEGLENGKMRSDGPPDPAETKDKKGVVSPKISGVEFFETKDWSKNPFGRYIRSKSTILKYAGSVIVIALVIWLLFGIFGSDESNIDQTEGASGITDSMTVNGSGLAGTEETETRHFSLFGQDSEASSESKEINEEPSETAEIPTGDNVIWIQSIAVSRKDELVSVAAFFRRKGIETEIIIHRNSGDAILVTKAGFEENPASKGTAGYALLQQIKQLGPVYVEETNDTKFGVKPFQSELGYKR